MEYGYSILMGIFAGALLLYAGLAVIFKDYKMIPIRARQSVKPKNEKVYMKQFAKVIALVSLSPALSAIAGLWNMAAAVVVLIASAIFFIFLGTKIVKNDENSDTEKNVAEPGKAASVTFINEVEEADIWILPQTEKILKTTLWGKATIAKLKRGDNKKALLNTTENKKYIIRIIDVDSAYYAADDFVLDDNYVIRFYTNDSKYDSALEVFDEKGNISASKTDAFEGVLGAN